MSDQEAKNLVDKIVGQIFGLQNPFTELNKFAIKFAFDIRLTTEVIDSIDNSPTWTQASKSNKYTSFENLLKRGGDGKFPKKPINDFSDILKYWNETNISSSERYLDSINIGKSDAIYGSQNVYRSIDIIKSKNIIFCETIQNSEYVAASQRSTNSVYSMRIDDSKKISGSFQITWSKSISNSFFIKDSGDLSDCMFCTGIEHGQFMIANMQYTEQEYRKWEKVVKQWILS